MNKKDFHRLDVKLKAAQAMIAPIKASKLEQRHGRWELKDLTLTKQFDKLMEEVEEFEKAYLGYRREICISNAYALLTEIADCQNVLDGIAYLVGRELGELK